MFPPGTRLGPYEIVAPIGSGGMGDVYRARDSRLSREVAIKVLPDRFLKDADARVRFEREARAVAALTHPNILAIHDFGTADGASYSVTELLEGQTLRQRLLQGALSWRKTIEVGAAIADGLAAAHAKGIIHRDLKPENIFLTADGRVKILDFGIAALVQIQSEDGSIDPTSMPTAPMRDDSDSVVMGTAGYMSPEQLRAQPAEATSDIFSLGCLLYEMVTGRAAFIRSTTIDSLSAILTETPDPFTATHGMIPFELAKLIDRCLEKNRAERFQSASDLAYALRAIGASTSLSFELPKTRRLRMGIIAALVLIAIAATGVFFLKRLRPARTTAVATTPAAIRTLAILPFTNATGDAEAEYMSDGITETLINTLSQVPGLKVMSRTSVFQYKGKSDAPVKIARELGVGAVVVGRVNSVGNRLAVSVELVDATDRSQLWGNRYTATRADIFSVQQSMAAEISRRLRLELTGREERLLSKRHTEDPAAYELYLKGRFQWNKRSAESLYKAIEFFNQAIEIDPQYALAYAGIADCYNLLDIWAGLPTKETFPKAKAAATKALSIDDQLAEAHTSLAYAIHNYEWKWDEAEREYRRALELNPNYATAHQWYSELLTATGRFDDAEREARKALDIDPMSPIINAVAGWNRTMARRYDAAAEQTLRTTQLFPAFMPGHAYLGLAKLESGKAAEAIPPLLKAQELLDIVVVRTWLARAQLAAGKREEAKRLLTDLESRGSRDYLPPYYMAALYAAFGDRDRAFANLEQALDERTGAMVWLDVDPALDPLRKDPRFDALRKRAGR
jgi:serine/threonine-protein kinase